MDYIAEPLRTLAVPIAELHEDPSNARKGHAVDRIAASLKQYGQRKPIVVNRAQGGKVEAGNGTLAAAKSLGWTHIAAVFVDDDAATAAAYGVADNRVGEFSEWDADILGDLIPTLDGLFTGFLPKELDAILPQQHTEGDTEPQVDRADELRQKWGVESGQMWRLGEHRIICGDCTDAEVVARVMGGEQINVAITSPPYASQREYDASSGFKPIIPDEYVAWFDGVQSNVGKHLSEDGSWFVNIKEHCEDGQRHLYVKDLTMAHVRQWEWLLVDEFCWLRSGYPGGWDNRFKNGFEPVFQFSRRKQIKFLPQNVSVPGITKQYDGKDGRGVSGMSNRSGGVGHKVQGLVRPSNVLDFKEPVHGGVHAAPFPVSLPSFFINAFSDKRDVVYEPFSGSGTTIIACENLGRKCRAVEISPAYVAVAIERWATHTGGVPELLP